MVNFRFKKMKKKEVKFQNCSKMFFAEVHSIKNYCADANGRFGTSGWEETPVTRQDVSATCQDLSESVQFVLWQVAMRLARFCCK